MIVIWLPITSLVAGIFAVLMVVLSAQVSMRRAQVGVVFGDANDDVLRRRIRAHGNFIEYAPAALIVLGLVELGGAGSMLVRTLAAGFVASRVLHALGMLYTSTSTVRATGMLLNHAGFLVAGAWLIRKAVSG